MLKDRNVGLFVMTLKGLEVLKHIIDAHASSNISFVCIGKDSAVLNDYSNDIISICKKNNIRFFTHKETLPLDELNYILAIAWRWLIDPGNYKIIVLHDSLLPRYRGFAPLVNALKNAESHIGVTALLASDKYDEGPIILQESIEIKYPIKIEEAIVRISEVYKSISISILDMIAHDENMQFCVQEESDATYSLWLDAEDYHIDWSWDSDYIERFVNAVGFPYDGAKAFLQNRMIKINEVEVINDLHIENRTPGKVVFFDNNLPVIVCGTGLVKLRNAVYYDDSVNIFPLSKFRLKFR